MIYTFYSFKGGVGRSMALANLAELFYSYGLSVLMVDFDLEAPGLERYFFSEESDESQTRLPISYEDVLARPGMMDMLVSYQDLRTLLDATTEQSFASPPAQKTQKSSAVSESDRTSSGVIAEPLEKFCTLLKQDSATGGKLQLITAGQRDEANFSRYIKSIQSFNWNDFYARLHGEAFFDWFRDEAEKIADIILIDSRTGITEMGGTCTHQLADCVLLFVGANQQNMAGTLQIVESLRRPSLIEKGRHGRALELLPIPSRIENGEAASLAQFAQQFTAHFKDVISNDLKFEVSIFDDLKIPYAPYYAYHEKIAVLSRTSGVSADLAIVFDRLALLIAELAPKNSSIRRAVKSKGNRAVPHNLPQSGAAHFVGRDEELEDLRQAMDILSDRTRSDRVDAIALVGTAGVGKTELALQYAMEQYRQRHYPGGICWLNARSENVPEQIIRFATENFDLESEVDAAGIGRSSPDEGAIEQLVSRCWQQWPKGKVLIVVDDVTNYRDIASYLPTHHAQFDILLTTRQRLEKPVQPFQVQELNQKGALALLTSIVDAANLREPIDTLWALCERLGNLPLALELTGRSIKRTDQEAVPSLLQSVQQQPLGEPALENADDDMTARLGMTQAIELSWQMLSQPEKTLTCLLGLFAAFPIDWQLVCHCAAYLEDESFKAASLVTIRDDGLVASSLLNKLEAGRYQMPRLVKDFALRHLEEQPDSGVPLQSAFCSGMVDAAEAAMGEAASDTARISKSHSFQHRFLVCHLKEMMSAAMADMLSDADKRTLAMFIGQFYASQEAYEKAEPWYRQGLDLTRSVCADDEDAIADTLHQLATICYRQKAYSQAESLYKEALSIRKSVFGAAHPKVADAMSNLASLYNEQEQYDEAEKVFREVLAMRRQIQIDDAYARSANNLATLYSKKGNLEEAEALYLESLALHRELLGKTHPYVAATLFNLAELHRRARKYTQAATLYRETLDIQTKALGAEHPDVAITNRRLRTLYQEPTNTRGL